jgi:hypothetical protein
MGGIDGGTIWQTFGAHIGGTSKEVEQSGRTSPFTHLQTQSAVAEAAMPNSRVAIKVLIELLQ